MPIVVVPQVLVLLFPLDMQIRYCLNVGKEGMTLGWTKGGCHIGTRSSLMNEVGRYYEF